MPLTLTALMARWESNLANAAGAKIEKDGETLNVVARRGLMATAKPNTGRASPDNQMTTPQTSQNLYVAQRRDHAAFLALVEIVQPRLAARARSLTQISTAEDHCGGQGLRAYERLDMPGTWAPTAWMLTILDRAAQRMVEKRKELPMSDAGEASIEPESADALLEIGNRSDNAEELDVALGRLEPSDRETLMLRFGAGLNAIEIGAALGVPAVTARMRLSRRWRGWRRNHGSRAMSNHEENDAADNRLLQVLAGEVRPAHRLNGEAAERESRPAELASQSPYYLRGCWRR